MESRELNRTKKVIVGWFLIAGNELCIATLANATIFDTCSIPVTIITHSPQSFKSPPSLCHQTHPIRKGTLRNPIRGYPLDINDVVIFGVYPLG